MNQYLKEDERKMQLSGFPDFQYGKILDGTPRAKWVRSCNTDEPRAKLPHLHVEDYDGNFSICTETESYQQMVQKALYEQAHDL